MPPRFGLAPALLLAPAYGFPTWYSAASSPYDAAQDVRPAELDILLFIDLAHNSSSLPDALYMYDTLSARPDIVVHVSGPLTPNWDADAGAAHNLERAGCRRILWRIGESAADLGNACLGSVVIEWATNVTGADICDIVSLSTTYPGVNARANITLVPEPYAMLSEESSYEALAGTLGEEWKMGLLAHVLPAANPEVFHPVTTLHRAVTYFPRVSTPASEYPLPPRGYQYSVYKQCPYLQPPNPAKDINVFNRSSAFRRFWTAYEAKSASHLARAGICIGWQDGVLDARMARAMLSGCIVAAAPPDVEYGTISHLILPLSKSDDALPASNIEAALSNLSNAELDKRVLRAFIFARRALVGPMRLSQIFSILDRWEQGARGYIVWSSIPSKGYSVASQLTIRPNPHSTK
ncbi:hypothetical protein CspHIS471_0304070 [Cutaneotrichosporon sp. HIS471]|nr:hypothetical protein CspHIS471_0304070 [Cutaneotrichosporon sp. HIS471]